MRISTMATNDLTFTSMVNDLSLPKLEEITFLAIAIQLMEDEEIKKIYCQHFSADNVERSLSDSTICKITSLCKKKIQLPDVFQIKLVSVLHWIRDQYFNWVQFVVQNLSELQREFENKMDYIAHIISSVKWSMGVIDKGKSLHQIFLLKNVENDEILEQMFRTASKFCLENDLKMLGEKMSNATISNILMDGSRLNRIFPLYWICKMRGDMNEFMREVCRDELELLKYHEGARDFTDLNDHALLLFIFNGDVSGVKYFKELANLGNDYIMHIIRIFLQSVSISIQTSSFFEMFLMRKSFCQKYPRNVKGILMNYDRQDFILQGEKLHFLLKEIKEERILQDIFNEFFEVFLLLSVQSWPWRKFFFPLLKMFAVRIDEVSVYDLMTHLLEDVKMKRAKIIKVKMLWKKIPKKVKKSFCLYISKEQECRNVRVFWKNMTGEVFDMFLEDEELRNIFTPYENFGIMACIFTGRYDLIEFWLQKCLVSENAIISFFENFIQTQSIGVMEVLKKLRYPFNQKIQFLEWVFKNEDLMNRDEIFQVKDEAISNNIICMFVYGFNHKKWKKLKKLIDWMMKDRNLEYEDELITWKKKAIEKFFKKQSTLSDFHSNDFKDFLLDFVGYGVNDSKKVKVLMRKVNLNEGSCCLKLLNGDFDLIDSYLRVLEDYGKDIFLTKKNIFNYVFEQHNENKFKGEKYCKNIRKLLYWNRESDEMKIEVEEIKKAIIKKYAHLNILNCMVISYSFTPSSDTGLDGYFLRNDDARNDIAVNNILKFLFEGNIENEEWSKMLIDLKIKVFEKISGIYIWETKDYYFVMVMLINWGKENKKVRLDNWEIKKRFIDCLENNIKAKIIPELILNWNFLSSFFEDEAGTDFEKTLWDFKHFLVEKVISDNDHLLSCKLLENLEGFSNFLNWNSSNEAKIQDLKIKIFYEKGVECCLFWIETDKLYIIGNFFNWSIPQNSHGEFILNDLKRKLLEVVVSNYSENWEENYFKRLDEFLSLVSGGDVKDLKRTVVEKFAVKGCSQCLFHENLKALEDFMKWAEINDEESIKIFKNKIASYKL